MKFFYRSEFLSSEEPEDEDSRFIYSRYYLLVQPSSVYK